MQILLVDDDAALRALIQRVLETAGCQVFVAADGFEASRKINQLEHVDVLVTDILMPEKDGLEVIQEFRQRWPSSRIIAMSGGGPALSAELCRKLAQGFGAAEVLEKPFQIAELLRKVQGPAPR